MTYFLCKLLPPRKSFIADMSPEEFALMGAHQKYWSEFVANGEVIALGPVADSAGSWGLAIIESDNEQRVTALQAKDPVIISQLGFAYENHLMPMLALRSAQLRQPVSSVTP